METFESHFHNWFGVLLFTIIYGVVIFFLPFYKKMDKKPVGTYFAFVVAFAIEMHGIPFSMYVISWIIGKNLPEGILWGHTLFDKIGYTGMYINIGCSLIGLTMIVIGWRTIYKKYWSKEEGKGFLVTSGIYRFIRHPQYTGLFLISTGMLCEWATLSLLILYPVIIFLYVRLAKREEKQMIAEFGQEYIDYMKKSKRFIPFLF